MRIELLNARQLRIGIKNGFVADDFCDKYQCSMDELVHRIGQIYHKNDRSRQNILAEIEANRKKKSRLTQVGKAADAAERRISKQSDSGAEAITVNAPWNTEGEPLTPEYLPECPPAPIAGAAPAVSPANKAPNAAQTAPATNPSPAAPLSRFAQLKESEHALNEQSNQLKDRYAVLAVEYGQKIKELRACKAEILKINEAFKAKKAEQKAIATNASALSQLMDDVSKERQHTDQALKIVRDEIRSLMVMNICVYDGGRFELLDDDSPFIVNDEGFEPIAEELNACPECEDLTIREIRALARLFKIAEHTECQMNLAFDSGVMEHVYYELFPEYVKK